MKQQSAHTQFLLTNRDQAMVLMMYEYGGVGIRHIQTKFFRTPHGRSACYTRVQKLINAGYLATQRLPAASGIGSGLLFVTCGQKARPILAKLLNCSQSELMRARRMVVPAQLQHHLNTVDVRLAIELAVESSRQIEAMEWTPEWELRALPVKVTDPKTNETITVVADGAFTLTLADGRVQSFFVEVDRATITELRRLRTRFRGWLLAAKAAPIPVLWVTTTEARAALLARIAREEAEKLRGADATIVWTTLQSQVRPETVLNETIWQVSGGPNAMTLLGESFTETTAPIVAAAPQPERVYA